MMNVSCPTEDQVRGRSCQTDLECGGQYGGRVDIQSQILVSSVTSRGHYKRSSRTVFTLAKATLCAVVVISCVTSRAAEKASWYGEKHRGLPMADGRLFNPDKLSAASWFFDLGTKVVVTHASRSVVVEITDRGPAKRLCREGRQIDLSRAAFARLASPDLGLIDVTVRKQ